jgi:hypothetical protein
MTHSGLNRRASSNAFRVFLRALWICRVPLTSALISLLMFWNLPQARDLFLEIRGSAWSGIQFWIGFYLLVVFAWLIPVYSAARLALECESNVIGTDERSRYQWFNFAIPFTIVLICIVSLTVGNLYAYEYLLDTKNVNVQTIAKEHLKTILIVNVSIALLFSLISGMLTRRGFVRRKGKTAQELAEPASSGLKGLLQNTARRLTTKNFYHPDTIKYFLFLVITSIIFAFLWIVNPITVSYTFPRALLIPIVLGFWVAPLSILGIISHRVKLPLIFFFLAGCALLDSLLDNNQVRTIDTSINGTDSPGQRIDLKQALEHWQKANGCEDGIPGKTCRRPIIVAAAGGASRAAFFTASVLGFLDDISAQNDAVNRFNNQLFAISSVSGSSVGAVSYLALHDLAADGSSEDLLLKARLRAHEDGLWYGNQVEALPGGAGPTKWKDALQILMAGDFLTPVTAAWLFRDLFPVGSLLQRDDRASVLEKAWEMRFRDILELPDNANPMMRPLISYAPTPERWRPILFLNGSMVENGKRVIASPINPHIDAYPCRLDCDPEEITEFYTDSYDFHDLINGATSPYTDRNWEDERLIRKDVSLSTAALLSARSPAISPHGTIKNRKAETVGHIVDGGYFENNGALTAIDLLNGLKILSVAADPTAGRTSPCRDKISGLTPRCDFNEIARPCIAGDETCKRKSEKIWPLIIQISNDPGTQTCGDQVVDPTRRIALPVIQQWHFFPSLMNIANAVLGARVARGSHASELLSYILDDDKEGYFAAYDELKPGFVHFRVCPQSTPTQAQTSQRGYEAEAKETSKASKEGLIFRDVSMSWWLSKPVQSYLDDELCNVNNKEAFKSVLMALSKEAAEIYADVQKSRLEQDQALGGLRNKFDADVERWCNRLTARNVSISNKPLQ